MEIFLSFYLYIEFLIRIYYQLKMRSSSDREDLMAPPELRETASGY